MNALPVMSSARLSNESFDEYKRRRALENRATAAKIKGSYFFLSRAYDPQSPKGEPKFITNTYRKEVHNEKVS